MAKAAGRRIYRRRGQRAVLGEREKRRLIQLVVCIAVFAVVLLSRGSERLGALRGELSTILCGNADFHGAFVDLDWSVAAGRSWRKTLNGLLTDVFLPDVQIPPASREGAAYHSAQAVLRAGGASELLQRPAGEKLPPDPMTSSGVLAPVEPLVQPQPEPAAEPAVVYANYTGPTLPDNTTMDRYALGLEKTATPLVGRMTSAFGWREHPIEGGEKFHCGVDLKADTGTPVLAFASGTVDYIGESDIYGQYLQLRHGNGVTSFYAHCSKLCVQQGQKVTVGEKVAESGATGEVTGPHLHFEMKKDGIRLNPAYYIETTV